MFDRQSVCKAQERRQKKMEGGYEQTVAKLIQDVETRVQEARTKKKPTRERVDNTMLDLVEDLSDIIKNQQTELERLRESLQKQQNQLNDKRTEFLQLSDGGVAPARRDRRQPGFYCVLQ